VVCDLLCICAMPDASNNELTSAGFTTLAKHAGGQGAFNELMKWKLHSVGINEIGKRSKKCIGRRERADMS